MKKITTVLALVMVLFSMFSFNADAQCNCKISFVKTNVFCNGAATGSVTASANSGVAPYTYLWANGETTATISGLAAGSYIVTATDANGCAVTDTAVITQKPALNTVQIVKAVTCFGACDGKDSVAVSGGTPPYSFVWSTGATTQAVSGLCPGIYTVTVTDSKGCGKVCVGFNAVTEPTQVTAGIVKTDVACYGACTGSANASASGGTPPYTYAWSNNATTAQIGSLCFGSYTVTVTDAKGCQGTATVQIDQSPEISSIQYVTPITCNGGCDGKDSVAVSGGTAPYSFVWSTGATTQVVTGLCPGIYTVTITDAKGCVKVCVGHNAVIQPPVLVVSTTKTDVLCFASCTGSATATATGGTAPYTYIWSNNVSGAQIGSLCYGSYTVTATDAKGCTATATVQIDQNSEIFSVHNVTAISCNGICSGKDSVSVIGGVGPYTFLWNNGATTQVITGLCAGTYTVTVTDAKGCSKVSFGQITQPTPIVISTSKVNVKCFGSCNGSASATPSGGTAPYTYKWSTGATTAAISALCNATYTITVTDAKGCTSVTTVVISQPSPVAANVFVEVANLPGKITSNPSGGTAPYTFLWNTGATTSSINNLGAGTFTVTVTDANGCTAQGQATLNIPCGGFNTHTQGGWGAPHNCTNSCHTTSNCNNNNNNWGWGNSNNNNCNNNNNNNNNCGNYWNNHSNNHSHNNNNCNNNNNNNNNNCGWGNNNNNNNNCSNYNWGGYCSGGTVHCSNANCTCDANPCGNPSAYMYANFAAAFPNGLTVGTPNKLKLTNALAVTNFLPSGSTPRALPNGTTTNPGQSYSNVLAGQLVALALNLGFDAYDPAFSASGTLLAAQVVTTGTFQGWSVQQVFDEANRKLGGSNSVYSFSQLNNAVTTINETYDNCTTNGCYLTCPAGGARIIGNGEIDESLDAKLTASMMSVYPNPSNEYAVVDFRNAPTTTNTVEVFNNSGQLVMSFSGKKVAFNEVTVDTKSLAPGVYTIALKGDGKTISQKLVVTH